MSRILVTGATGFIGRRLVPALIEKGHEVRAMTRRPEAYDGPGDPVGGDVNDADSLTAALEGVDVAYYLVHSLDDADFERKDAEAARAFAKAAADQGVRQIIYMGGLGDDGELSAHLRSRRQVEGLLAETGVPVTVLRAAIVVGAGGISWEITRQLVKNLPAMVVPKWADHDDAADRARRRGPLPGRRARRGRRAGADLRDRRSRPAHLRRHAAAGRGRGSGVARCLILEVPVLTPRLSSYWLALVTDVDVTTGRNLIDSMGVEVVVREQRIREVVPGEPIGYAEAVRRALAGAAATPDGSGQDGRQHVEHRHRPDQVGEDRREDAAAGAALETHDDAEQERREAEHDVARGGVAIA